MVYRKDPTAVYHNEVCDECRPNFYIFGIHDDGVGNKKLTLQIYIDKEEKILYPMSVYKAKMPDPTN